MQYYNDIDGRETYIGRTSETKPIATNFEDGLRYLDVDLGIWYTVSNGVWIIDKSKYNGSVYNSDGVLVNTSDAYYDTAITAETIESRYLRQGYVYGAGYTWSTVVSNATVNLYMKVGSRPIYMNGTIASVALSDYGLVGGATISTNGTALPILKRNNAVIVEPTTLMYRDCTYTGGTIAIPRFLGAGGNAIQRVGGSDNVTQVALLQANSNYIVSLKNSNTATQERMGIYIDWIEVEV